MNVTLSLTLIVLLLFTACGTTTQTGNKPNNAATAGSNEKVPSETDTSRAFRLEFKTEAAEVKAGTPTTMIFTVKDKEGTTVNDLQIVHEKPMHLLIVSEDLAEFYHLHPEPTENGSYRVQHTFPNGGGYKLYADFTPKDAVQVVEQVDLKVTGTERAKVALVADTAFTKTENGLKVSMRPDGPLRAGAEVMLNFQALDAASGKPATDLQNYLGELAHFVIISEDMKDFVHAHPMSKGEHGEMGKTEQGDHNADGHKHSTMESTTVKPSASEVSAHTSFPRSGLYKIWAQFQRGGQIITVPFTVSIPEGARTSAKAANVPDGYTQVTVSKDGYSPSSINVKSGEKVSLAFYRADDANCGDEVIFAKQKIKKTLPVGDTVLVEFTAGEAGEITFACGMGMLRGKVVVGGI